MYYCFHLLCSLSASSLDAVITNHHTSADDQCERLVPAGDEQHSEEERIVFLCWTTVPSVHSEDATSTQPESTTNTQQAAIEGATNTPSAIPHEAATNTPLATGEDTSNIPPATNDAAANTPPSAGEGAPNAPPATNEAAANMPPAAWEGAPNTPPATNEAATKMPQGAGTGTTSAPPAAGVDTTNTPPATREGALQQSSPTLSNENDAEPMHNTSQV